MRLLQSLTAFSNLVLQGKTRTAVRPFFFGANLIALGEEGWEGGGGGGGQAHSSGLVAKCAGSRFLHSIGSSMAPLQLGCGIPQGCKAAVHAAQMYIQDLPSSHVLLKLDFQNAFNTLRQDCMLNVVRESAQELYHFIHSAYEKPSNLFCGGQVIHSSEGIQQGDPLGCFLFCLTIHPLVKSLQSELRIFYVDDGTLGGHKDEVLQDLQRVESEAAKLGLQLNRHKSELICDDIGIREAMMEEVPGLQTVKLEEAEILGAPLGKSVNDSIQRKAEKLRLMGDRLQLLQSQDALLLLRHSFVIPKVMHILRSSPCFSSPQLKVFDDALRDILGDIINARIDDSAWAQASLPVRSGGIGIRSAVQLAPSAFLASAAGCTGLIQGILPPRLQGIPEPYIKLGLNYWSQKHEQPPPPPSSAHQQKAWDAPVIEASYETLFETASEPRTRARLLAVASRGAGVWLNALPVAPLGLRMDNETTRIAVGLHPGLPLCRPHQCLQCGSEVDQLGTHGLSCRYSQGRHSRHAAVNDLVKRSLDAAQIPSHLKPVGLYRSDGKRPDGASVLPWRGGKILIWDATCICPDTFASSYEPLATREAGAVAAEAEYRKRQKYANLDGNHFFVPVAVETLGVIGPESESFLRDLTRKVMEATGEPSSHQYLLKRLSVAIQRGNSAAIQGTALWSPTMDFPCM